MPPNVHKKLPPNVFAKIAGFAVGNGIEDLKNYIRAYPELKNTVLSDEALYRLCTASVLIIVMISHGGLTQIHAITVFSVRAKKSYALYIESIRLAFNVGEIDVALYILDDVKNVHPHAKLMFIMLCFCAGRECLKIYLEFQRQFKFGEVEWMDKEMMYHIDAVNPRKADTYIKTWHPEDFPECWEVHS